MFIEERQAFHWRQAKRNKQEVNICTRLLFGTLLVSAVASTPVLAAPVGGVATGGGATIAHGADTVVNQTNQRVDITWTSFDTTATESVTFNQPNGLSVAINRITNGTRTQYDGMLNANGQVYLINKAGITFGATSQVNVGALLATSLETNSTNRNAFVAGGTDTLQLENYQGYNTGYSSVINNGNITIAPGGFAVLAAPYVENNGIIDTRSGLIDIDGAEGSQTQYAQGQVELISTNRMDLNPNARGAGLVTNVLEGPEGGGSIGVTNTGTLRSLSGHVNIEARLHASDELMTTAVNLDGVIDADALATDSGTGGTIMVASVGDINFSDLNGDGVGADIHAHGGHDVSASFQADGSIRSTDDTRASIDLLATAENDGHDEIDATLNVEAEDHVIFRGDITVKANNSQDDDDATANVDVDIRTEGGDVRIFGDIVAEATTTATSGEDSDADTHLDIVADNQVEIVGDIKVAATANQTNDNDADAHAYLEIEGQGTSEEDGVSVKITGNVLVDATANAQGGTDASASAEAYITGAYDVNITGNTEVLATARTHDLEGYYVDADAEAYLEVWAGDSDQRGQLDITGDVIVAATATVASGEEDGYEANADAFAGALLTAADDVNITGNPNDGNGVNGVDVRATANTATSDYDQAFAGAFLGIIAGNTGYEGFEGFIDPDYIDNFELRQGDVNFTGDINVVADADAAGMNDAEAGAFAMAAIIGGDDVNIDTDPVRVIATADGAEGGGGDYNYANSQAAAGLFIAALGNESDDENDGGNVNIRGDVSAQANANPARDRLYGDFYDDYDLPSETAVTAIYADNNLTIVGQEPLAVAGLARVQGQVTAWQDCSSEGCSPVTEGLHGVFDGGEGYTASVAQLVIDAENVDIQPDESKFVEEIESPLLARRAEEIEPIEPDFPGSRPPSFDEEGNFVQSDSLTAAGEPTPPQGLDDTGAVIAGDITSLLPPPAAGPEAAKYKDNCDKLVNGACETTGEGGATP